MHLPSCTSHTSYAQRLMWLKAAIMEAKDIYRSFLSLQKVLLEGTALRRFLKKDPREQYTLSS